MRSFKSFISLVAAALGGLGSSAIYAGTPINVVLLGGQSNMDGRASMSQLPANLQAPQDNIPFFYQTQSSGGGPTTGTLTTLRPLTTKSGISGILFGPEITFGQKIAADDPANKYALIKYSQGGTTLAVDWNATTNGVQYQNFKSTVASGLAALTGAGYSPNIVGMLWMQGETDAVTSAQANAYQANLTTFIASVRSNYGANLPFILGGIGDQKNGNASTIDPFYSTVDGADQAVAASTLRVGYFTNIDLAAAQSPPFSDIHFDSPVGGGYQTIGNRFATTFEAVAPEPASCLLLAVAGMGLLRRPSRGARKV